MSGKQEPLVSLVAHHVRFFGPRPPAAAARDAKLVPELAPYTKTVFALFQRLRGDRLVPDWWHGLETVSGHKTHHIRLAWKAQGRWLFAGTDGLATLGSQAGYFDWVRFEHARRRDPLLRSLLDELYFGQARHSWQMNFPDQPFQPPPPVSLEMWVVINQTRYSLQLRGTRQQLLGQVSPDGVACFVVWEAGRSPLYVCREGSVLGKVDERTVPADVQSVPSRRRLVFVPSGQTRVRGFLFRLPEYNATLHRMQGHGAEALQRLAGVYTTDLEGFASAFDALVLMQLTP
jgi:hypothetical protein